ncbi:phosphomannomutase [Sorangium cellulosum]|uniref:Phosphomannomutase n=1 Tax=Sorangium cellulosum TaxID=56 RepID=A0A150U318_SORCE|nr:phosphomannomutase [Sorangium cellulosum]
MSHDFVLEPAERWLAHDPDPETQSELRQLIAAARAGEEGVRAELAERFAGPLEFGTAGIRGVLGAGESRMNRAVILRTTAGLARYLLATLGDKVRSAGVVVGYDARRRSREFAEDTACALAAAGIPSHLSPVPCPTPIAAFAVGHLGAAAGVMVTASHNPPEYNGYKVYWDNAAQIIPPHDTGIATAIDAAPPADQVPRMPLDEARQKGLVRDFPEELEERYLRAILGASARRDGDRGLRIVYTPLHGVGDRLVREALERAGFTRVTSVPEQAEPDGAFPTVAFPNPEEKGAMDLAFALARREGAELVLANDPDVDRLAVAVRRPDGELVQLTGNQVGVLLGHYLLTEGGAGAGAGDANERRLVLASCVSTPLLGVIAASLGVHYEETLTGFKWIANRAMDIERSTGARFVFGFEEALGYTIGSTVRDKDGISAAVALAELAAARKAGGTTLLDELEAIHRKHGLYVSGQRSYTLRGVDGVEKIAAIMAALRKSPPAEIGGVSVAAWRDFEARTRTSSDGQTEPLVLPPSNVLVYELDGGSRIIARPSGTEPKIKFYFDVREEVAAGEPLADAEARAAARLDALARAFSALAGVG